jgi:hypothetical protein
MKPLKFKIDATIFDSLRKEAEKLPKTAPNGGYDKPAGLALLGCKEDVLNMVVPLKMNGGCWDAPDITFESMDKGLRTLIKNDNICVGMALLRHPKWQSSYYDPNNERDSRISNDIRRQVNDFKNCFEDIEQTVWICLYKDYFRTYRATIDTNKRIVLRETSANAIYDNTDKSDVFKIRTGMKETIIAKNKERKEKLKKEREEWEQKQKLLAIEHKKQIELEEHKQKLRSIKDSIKINKDMSEKKKKKIDLGNGMVFILNGEGEYILWQNQ